MNIIINKKINLLNNFKYCDNIYDIKSCNNLIYVICDIQHLSQIDIIKQINYKKIFIIIDIDNITNSEQINIENQIKQKIDNLNNSNLFVRNKIYGWNLILDVIKNNLEKNTMNLEYFKNLILPNLHIIIIIILIGFIMINTINHNKKITLLNQKYESLQNETNINMILLNQKYESLQNETNINMILLNQKYESLQNETNMNMILLNQKYESLQNETNINMILLKQKYESLQNETNMNMILLNQKYKSLQNETNMNMILLNQKYKSLQNETNINMTLLNQKYELLQNIYSKKDNIKKNNTTCNNIDYQHMCCIDNIISYFFDYLGMYRI